MAFKKLEGNEEVYYIKGIVSNGRFLEETNKCDKFYTLFTNVLEYISFIRNAIEKYP